MGLAVEAGVQLDLDDAAAEADVDTVQRAATIADGPMTAPSAPSVSGGSNGNGPSGAVKTAAAATTTRTMDVGTASMQSALSEMMGDAPLCDVCGHITVRNGSCFKCLNCGNSLGCS
jgi:ribonucleoside-diphosphate reductase alpha chain